MISETKGQLIIRGGTLIDGSGGPAREDTFILIENGRIKVVDEQTRATRSNPEGMVIDATHKTILPGLWDVHVHLADWMGELYLSHGVTSILDAANIPDWILAQRDGRSKGYIRSPRIFACGNALGGHPLFGEDDPAQVLRGADDARHRVCDAIAAGVDVIKIWAFAEADEMEVMCREAHEAGLPVMAHLTTSARDAVLAGVKCLAHCTGLPMAAVKDPSRRQWMVERERERLIAFATHKPAITAWSLFAMMEEDTFDPLIETFIEHGTFLEPDFVYRWAFASPDRANHEDVDKRLLEHPGLSYLPGYVRYLVSRMWGYYYHLSTEQREELARGYEKFCTFLRRYVEAGGKTVIGSDTSTWPLPGISIHRELVFHVEAGLSPAQAIVAATRYPAEFVGKADSLGTVEPGKIADLLIVEGDPLRDIRATQNIAYVIMDGQLVDRTYHQDFANAIPRPRIGLFHANPVPHLTAVMPRVVEQGCGSTLLAVRGSGFIRQSIVMFDEISVPTTFCDTETLEATIPSWLLARVGTFPVWVANPNPVRSMDYLHEDERSNPGYLLVKFAK